MRSEPTRRALLGLAFALALSAPAAAEPVKIGIVGAGKIGGTIGTLWARAGHAVMFASRHPEDLKDLVEAAGPRARAGTPEEAVRFGDAVFLAVPYKAYPDLAETLGPALAGKVVLDAGNATRARDGALYDEVQANGLGATAARYFPGAKLVRAFSTANYRIFAANAGRAGARMAIPILGDDPAALALAAGLVRDAGFEPVVAGGLKEADRFAIGAPGFGHDLTAPELRRLLGLAP